MAKRRPARKRLPPPVDAFSATDLAEMTGVNARKLRFYVEQRLLPAPVFRGRGTRYSEEHLQRVAGIVALQREGHSLDTIRVRIANASPAKLAAWGRTVRAASGLGPERTREVASPAPVEVAAVQPADAGRLWERIPILPGLELHLRSGASPHVLKVVREIEAQFRSAAGPKTS